VTLPWFADRVSRLLTLPVVVYLPSTAPDMFARS
jgi:hypothetical protein